MFFGEKGLGVADPRPSLKLTYYQTGQLNCYRLKVHPVTSPTISIIIPVLNEEKTLGETLSTLPCDPDLEVIIVDGGSTDDTLLVVAQFPLVKIITAPRGRGCQMNAGALASSGEFLVFLHADTLLMGEHLRALRQAATDPAFEAGAFELGLKPSVPALRFIAWGANRRARLLELPYGDQVLIIKRSLFWWMGGFTHRRPEDLDLVLRLRGRTRLKILTPPVSSSGRRWLERGYLHTTLHNWLALARHLAERALTSSWTGKGDLAGGEGGGQGSRTSAPSLTPPPPNPLRVKRKREQSGPQPRLSPRS